MAHKENKSMKVRHAGLDDALQVSDIHRSYVDRWYRRLEAEQFDVPYDALSLGERWGFGGPWMSVETCSIHLNNLLLQHQYPFVAHRGDSLVGEMELFLGNEGAPYGKNLHIGLLYVKKGLTGHGIGKALVDRAFEFAAGQECDTITVASAMANVGFYEKCGFELADNMVELEAITKAYDVDIAPMLPPLNMWSFARGMTMPVGRYQSSAFHIFEQLDVYAIPEFLNVRRERVFARVNGHPSMLAFVRYDTVPASADVHAWSEGGAEALTQAALTLLHNEGIKYANILLTGNDYNAMADGVDAAVKGSRSALSRIMK